MKILITGNNGYIGSVLSEMLINLGHDVTGLDTNFFFDCKLIKDNLIIKQINKDIREVNKKDLDGFESIIHLAALSNDPLGELSPIITKAINFQSTLNLAILAKKCKIKRFIYASSQSMYGISQTSEILEEDAPKNPLTVYASTKWNAEIELKKLNDKNFNIVCFRPSTVFGSSPRLRCDIVFNNLVGCALTTGKIEIMSDGSPWRPVIHINDVCNAFIAGITAPVELISGQSFNVGIDGGNYTIKTMAEIAKNLISGCDLIFLNQHTDPRTYKISFKKIHKILKDYFKPKWNLENGGSELIEFLKRNNFNENIFRGRKCNRLKQLKYLLNSNFIDNNLIWKRNKTVKI